MAAVYRLDDPQHMVLAYGKGLLDEDFMPAYRSWTAWNMAAIQRSDV